MAVAGFHRFLPVEVFTTAERNRLRHWRRSRMGLPSQRNGVALGELVALRLRNLARQQPFAAPNSDHRLVAMAAEALPPLRFEIELGPLCGTTMANQVTNYRHDAPPDTIGKRLLYWNLTELKSPETNDNRRPGRALREVARIARHGARRARPKSPAGAKLIHATSFPVPIRCRISAPSGSRGQADRVDPIRKAAPARGTAFLTWCYAPLPGTTGGRSKTGGWSTAEAGRIAQSTAVT